MNAHDTTLFRGAVRIAVANCAWTEERVDILIKLWAEGLSAGVIGQRLGKTRNAVIGKVHRLRLPTRKTLHARAPIVDKREARQRPPRTIAPRIPRGKKGQASGPANRIAAGTFAKPLRAPAPPPPPNPWDGPPISIMSDGLTRLMCRCIVSGSGLTTMFCGAPVTEGSQFMFCDWHKQTLTRLATGKTWSPAQRERFVRAQLRRAATEWAP